MASHGWLARVQYGWLKRLTGPGLVGYTAHTYCQLTLTVEMGMGGNGNSTGELGGMGIGDGVSRMCRPTARTGGHVEHCF